MNAHLGAAARWLSSGPNGPGFDAHTPTIIVTHSAPDDAPDGGVYIFVPGSREAIKTEGDRQ